MELYDMETQEWREGNFQRGDSFRSKQVYMCGICRTKTNALFCGGYPGWGVRTLCPGDHFTEHDEIEEAQKEWVRIGGQRAMYGPYLAAAEKIDETGMVVMMDQMLQAQQLVLQVKMNALREKFAGLLDDVVGIPEADPAMLREYWPGARFGGEKKSLRGAAS